MRLTTIVTALTLLVSANASAATGAQQVRAHITPPIKSCITSGYGARKRPVKGATSFHEAVDFRAQCGTLVNAAADGVVTFAGWYRGYGNQLRIRHADGTETRYSHLSKITVRPGAHVGEGRPVAKSGRTTSIKAGLPCHLHFEILARRKNGTYGKINPEPFVRLNWCNGKRGKATGGHFLTR